MSARTSVEVAVRQLDALDCRLPIKAHTDAVDIILASAPLPLRRAHARVLARIEQAVRT